MYVCTDSYIYIYTFAKKKSTQSRYRKAATVNKNFKNAYLKVNGENNNPFSYLSYNSLSLRTMSLRAMSINDLLTDVTFNENPKIVSRNIVMNLRNEGLMSEVQALSTSKTRSPNLCYN